MKYWFINLSLVLFLTFLLINTSSCQNSQYTEAEAKFYANYSKIVGCAQKPLNINCPKCVNPGDGYKFYFFYQTTRINKFNYKFMIHYNDIQKRYLITFSGPSVNNHIYIKYIYSAGFSLVKRYRFQIEKEFYQIYFNKIRKVLYSKIHKINSSGRKNFTAHFVGHSIGGSLATLAAFDMQQLKLVQNPKVFAFAPLRLGDATFVALVNSYVTVYRIVKKSDYLVRIPNCYFSPTYKVWRCFTEKIVREFILKTNFPLKVYVKNYLTYFTRGNVVLQKAIIYARKKLGLGKENTNGVEKTLKKYNHKSNKKANKIKRSNKNKAVKAAKKDVKKKKDVIKQLRIQKKKFQKTLEKLNKQIKKSKINKVKNNTKKTKNLNRKISKSMKKLNKMKELPKKIKNSLRKLLNKKNNKLLKAKPTTKRSKAKVLKKLNKFLRKAESITKKIKSQIGKINKKLRVAKDGKVTKKTKSPKIKASSKKQSRKKAEGKLTKHKNKTSKKDAKDKNNKNNKKTKKASPIKKLQAIQKPVMKSVTSYYTYIPSYTQIKLYSPLDTYFSFIYYTQPIGYHIYYNDAMTEYTQCQYNNGISQCEKIVTLPNEFTVDNHLTYFNINFEKCK